MDHSRQPDSYFIEQVMEGRSEAFAVLVERYMAVARAVALAQTRNLDDADDVAQEALLKAYTSLGQLRDRKRFGAWLVTWRGFIVQGVTERGSATFQILLIA